MKYKMGGLQMTLSGERPALKKVFEYPPEKTRKLESYIRPVETRTTNISGGNNPRFVVHVAHVKELVDKREYQNV